MTEDFDLLDLLSADHDNLIRTDNPAVSDVMQHLHVERVLLYPLMSRYLGDESLAGLRAADSAIERLVEQLDNGTDSESNLPELPALIGAHISTAGRAFATLREIAPAEELAKLGSEVPATLAEAPTRPHPHLVGTEGLVEEIGTDLAVAADKVRDVMHRRGPERA